MPALQVRDCPDGLYRELSACAESEHRSISQQIVVALEEYLGRRERERRIAAMLDRDMPLPLQPWERGYAEHASFMQERASRSSRRHEVFERIGARGPIDVPDGFPSAEEIVREMRDAR